jgi:hypothetical protein
MPIQIDLIKQRLVETSNIRIQPWRHPLVFLNPMMIPPRNMGILVKPIGQWGQVYIYIYLFIYLIIMGSI